MSTPTNNDDEVQVEALRFFEGTEGHKAPGDPPFTVCRQRYADLAANGLVRLAKEERVAPTPANKMKPDHETKSDGDDDGSEQPAKRGRPRRS